ncbi:MAG: hypothetical protein R6U84_08000 [Candidatus Cloacimonadales bacterium]
MKKRLLLLIAATMLFSLIVFSGCDDRSLALDDINIASLTISPNEVEVGDTLSVFVRAILKDDDGFGVTNTKVLFRSSAGSLNPSSVYTDSSGVAKVEFDYSSIDTANVVTIDAYVNDKDSGVSKSEEITIGNANYPEIRSLRFDVNPIALQVAETGGTESADLNVHVYDYQGELITQPKEISFIIVSGPEGLTMNDEVTFPDTVSVMSQNGIATVSISSGQDSGGGSIKAFATNTSGQMIQATKNNIVVQAGPPETVEFIMPGHNSAADMGAGSWKVQVAALINDAYGNPVGDGTTVFFKIEDDISYASLETQYSYVGNENASGDTLAGAAFTFLNYDGTHTNDSFNISVEVSDIDFPAETITLPIQFPVLEVTAIPMNLAWTIEGDNSDKITELHVVVTDGQQNRINKQLLYFTGNLGEPREQSAPELDDPGLEGLGDDLELYEGITYDVNFLAGRVIKGWGFSKYECPPPSQAGPGTTSANVSVTIPGANTSNNVNVILYRYVD